MQIRISAPFENNVNETLRVGDQVLISGIIFSARDMAHKLLTDELTQTNTTSISLKNQIIYYVGTCPPRPGTVVGSAGPTTSSRVDAYTPRLLDSGLKGMIGKGFRKPEVVRSMIKNKCVYFGALGGAGALISQCIKECSVVKWEELGTEAMFRMVVKDFPAVVLIDSLGNNLYETGPRDYLDSLL